MAGNKRKAQPIIEEEEDFSDVESEVEDNEVNDVVFKADVDEGDDEEEEQQQLIPVKRNNNKKQRLTAPAATPSSAATAVTPSQTSKKEAAYKRAQQQIVRKHLRLLGLVEALRALWLQQVWWSSTSMRLTLLIRKITPVKIPQKKFFPRGMVGVVTRAERHRLFERQKERSQCGESGIGLRYSFYLRYKRYLHGGKITMLYLNLSGHDMFKKRGLAPHRKNSNALPPFFKETYKTDIK